MQTQSASPLTVSDRKARELKGRQTEITLLIGVYFQAVNATLAGNGYRVGVYGSGLVCNALLANGLAELCWLAAPTSWPDFSAYYQTKRWRLVQLPTTQCGGRSVDFNLANGPEPEYGQFGR